MPARAAAADRSGGRWLQAVLFDMDGTLLDSEKVWTESLAQTAQWLGGELSQSAREQMIGSSLARSISILHADLDLDADRDATAAYLLGRTEQLFSTSLVWKPGARELLVDVADSGIPAALVTSTHRRLTERALDTIGREFFAVSVCGNEVEMPKPHPEPYLRAAELLGADPARCVAIEDSPLGIAAAEAAGCVVLAVPSEVEVSPAPSTTVWSSLAGRSASDLLKLPTLTDPVG